MDVGTIEHLLKCDCTLVVKDSVTSTNDEAMRMLRELQQNHLVKPIVVISSKQTAGRGRLGRKWTSPPGGLYISFALQPQAILQETTTLPLLLALAIRRVLQEFSATKVHIKWPNDLLTDTGKLCGILIETSSASLPMTGSVSGLFPVLIAGVGINVNRLEDRGAELVNRSVESSELTGLVKDAVYSGAAYLSDAPAPVHVVGVESGLDADAEPNGASEHRLSLELIAAKVINEVLDCVNNWTLAGFDFSVFQTEYQQELILMGKDVLVSDISGIPFTRGIVTGVDVHGRLLLQYDGVIAAIAAGDVTLRKP